MSEEKNTQKDSLNHDGFIRQKIIHQKKTLKQQASRLLSAVGMGIIIGGVACITFVFLLPQMETYTQGPTESIPITIPPDETLAESNNLTESADPVEEIVQSAIDQNQLDIEDYQDLFRGLSEVAQNGDKSIVTIGVSKHGTDWFDNTFTHGRHSAGILIAKTEAELLILTRETIVRDADSLEVYINSITMVNATVKQSDSVSDLAVISVPKEGVDAAFWENLIPIPLGNSHVVKQGDPMIILGNPSGTMYSVIYGTVVDIRKNVQIVDGTIRIMDLDGMAEDSAAGFVINLNGELVGIMNHSFQINPDSKFVSAMAVSDLKGLIEKMSNGQKKNYLGVRGQEITESISETTGLPRGIYIQEVLPDSPAYQAGLQNGDIITRINGKEIAALKDLQIQLDACLAGDIIGVKIQRSGNEEYKEIDFEVSLGVK